MSRERKPVYGVGINDADYMVAINEKIDGKWKHIWNCPYYKRWAEMLKRCYSPKYHDKKPTYKDCIVCEDWLLFSNFKVWMITQPWKDNQLDKDILNLNNKAYSPETCVFIDSLLNSFTTGSNNSRGKYPIGVTKKDTEVKYRARVNNPFTTKTEHIGSFHSAEEAHLAWKDRKHKYACALADSDYVTDERVAIALRKRYK